MPTDALSLELVARDLIRRHLDEAARDRLADQLTTAAFPGALLRLRHAAAATLREMAIRMDPCDPGFALARPH